MHTTRNEMTAIRTGDELLGMLAKATAEGKAAAADLCSARLEKLASHAASEGLSAAEIVELVREEAMAICSKGGAAWN
ncbi:DUF2732 family protein [Escherichia coli]|jgi:uncharacterized protein YdbL (DUF1318 family)|uniref:DUF2732 family protein n=1 Tax=Escherichia coli TaxID=562 RepID=UPI0006A5ACD7|nr:DUF2732 family protein [Escherichia coli]DAV50602.1 MAG TPA: Protein of unknown function (DUF2732) [Caudoviricetes sp.]EEW1868065.1 DUF2732 family protein [Escherichia coli]EHW7196792.1 DUF2732 family protein [Escherichia coli]BEA72156.1 hypothetical protein VEE01_13170 [Escherichia coli]HAW0175303.1 DUF2732 family protein [Escherichia coli]